MTSHAAVVARGMGTPCVSGCEAMTIGTDQFTAGGITIKKGDWLTIDGSTGNVFEGKLPTLPPSMSGDVATFLGWADDARDLGVRTNADDPVSSGKAREFGAEGIGLVRTEHMFMGDERLPHMQAMIMAETEDERREALAKLLPFQEEDFYGIFKAMDGLPVTIRFLDPPMHEFLPDRHELAMEIAAIKRGEGDSSQLAEKQRLHDRAENLAESNPMMGLRGVRLGVFHIEVYEMQVRAIFQAAARAQAEGATVLPEIMIPLVSLAAEMDMMRAMVERIAKEMNVTIAYKVGTMIEIPRAAIVADKVARSAEFFSFGTNDLTQMTYGFSRDDAEGKFFKPYLDQKVMPCNPFVSIDPDGVGQLVQMAAERGRSTRPDLKLGICGEHGGDPQSIEFVNGILDYVSCSPYRVPIARLAAAQAAIRARRSK
jgi:pyruvate,orthophosphate dikinase